MNLFEGDLRDLVVFVQTLLVSVVPSHQFLDSNRSQKRTLTLDHRRKGMPFYRRETLQVKPRRGIGGRWLLERRIADEGAADGIEPASL